MSGDGVLARRGDLVLLSSLDENGLLDALLELLAEIADAGGDGPRFADVVEDMIKSDGRWDVDREEQMSPAVVAFGPAGAGLAVTVSGAAWAELTTAHGMQRLVAGQPSMLLRCTTGSPVSAVHGGLSTVRGDIARTDRFSRLDRGTARAGGLSYYPDHPAISGAQPSVEAMPVDIGAAGSGVPEKEAPELSAPEKEAPELGPPEAAAAESGTPDVASVEAEAVAGRPFDAILLIGQGLGDVEARPPLPLADAQADAYTDDAPVPIILGAYCKNGHFDDPEARYCAVCGISMNQRTLVPRLGPRPPLGLLVLDDGALLQLDADYVIGREPTLDASVAAGKARPLRITDKGGTVSRVHAQIQLDEWLVLVTDLDSANGTRIRLPNEAAHQSLIPRVPALLQPGSHVDLGGRGFRYESHRGR